MTNLQNLKELLREPKRIFLLGHQNPDGDAIGSTLALQQVLAKMGHRTTVMVPNEFPKFLKWMPGAKDVFIGDYSHKTAEKLLSNAELVFLLDFNTLDRIGLLGDVIGKLSCPKVLIDHHQQPDTFDFMYSDTSAPATCFLVYKFIQKLEQTKLIDKDVASCLYTGLITDTGNFRYVNTTPETLSIASELLGFGIDLPKIQTQLFDSQSFNRIQLLGRMLSKMEYFPPQRTALMHITREEQLAYDFEKGDTEGFVNYGLSINNTVLSAFFKEDVKHDFIKISFRSKGDFDVNSFARKHFNGGGHLNAAGGRSDIPMAETLEKFKALLVEYQTELQNATI